VASTRSPRALAALALAAALAVPAAARALSCGSISAGGAPLGETQVEDRSGFLRDRLTAARPPARAWSLAWGITDGALTAGQLAALPFARAGSTRALLAAGAAVSALGVLQIVFMPIAPPEPPRPSGDSCAELSSLEDALQRSARNERLGAGALAQAGNVLVNAGFGVAAALVGGWRAGAWTAGLGWALGEAQLLTQPTGLVDDLARYRGPTLALPAPASAGARPERGAVLSLAWTF
jgi:hypothetical protein